MSDQKISELTALTGANVADDDAIAIVDTSATETKKIVFSELKNALDTATGFVKITGDTMTGNLNMGDNVKAIFGAGSDLQIYHDGTRSYVDDTGTGSLWLRGGDVAIKSTASETMADFANNGAVQLYYDNAIKLATTSTGIAVTGSVYLGGTGSANALSDYEEGNWTPAVSNMTVTGTLTTAGRYTKVGRMVSLMGWISATTSIAHSASALISGFPFAGAFVTGENQSRSAGVIVAGANADLPSSNHSAACFVDSPNSRAFLGNFTTTAANEYIYINVVYYTA